MTLKITRLHAGEYRTSINDREVEIWQSSLGGQWQAFWMTDPEGNHWSTGDKRSRIAEAPTKKALVSRLEILARQTKDRTKSSTHKIPRRSELTKGTELSLIPRSVPGVHGRVRFLGYTKTNSNVEWLDVVDSNGRSRAVDPAKVKTVHRDKKMGWV